MHSVFHPLRLPRLPLMMLVSDEAAARYHAGACQDLLIRAVLIITECPVSSGHGVLRDLIVEYGLRDELLIVLLRV